MSSIRNNIARTSPTFRIVNKSYLSIIPRLQHSLTGHMSAVWQGIGTCRRLTLKASRCLGLQRAKSVRIVASAGLAPGYCCARAPRQRGLCAVAAVGRQQRRQLLIARQLRLHCTMTTAELETVPELDRSQFSSTLQLKALRLEALQCQKFVKALLGCA